MVEPEGSEWPNVPAASRLAPNSFYINLWNAVSSVEPPP